jgi:hypothetical protein
VRKTARVSPIGPLEDKSEQSEAERLAIARRYRVKRGAELRELATRAVGHEVSAAGQFSTQPLEALAAIPVVGAALAIATRLGGYRRRLPPDVLVALDRDDVHLIALRLGKGTGARPELEETFPRSGVRVSSVRPRFMRQEVTFEIEGGKPLRLYAPSLRTSPWTAEVVRELGGDAPEPLDLGDREAP